MNKLFLTSFSFAVACVLLCPQDAGSEDYLEKFNRLDWCTAPGDALFLKLTIQATQSKRGLEIGTYRGHGAIYMAYGYRQTDGHLWTIEINPSIASEATQHFTAAGVSNRVTLLVGDALEFIPKIGTTFDFVFIDAKKEDYHLYFQAVEPYLEPGAVIIADNIISHKKEMKPLTDYLEQRKEEYEFTIIRTSDIKNDGVLFILKSKGGSNE